MPLWDAFGRLRGLEIFYFGFFVVAVLILPVALPDEAVFLL